MKIYTAKENISQIYYSLATMALGVLFLYFQEVRLMNEGEEKKEQRHIILKKVTKVKEA